MKHLFVDQVESELGPILLVTDGVALCGLDFAAFESRLMTILTKRFGTIQLLAQENPQGFSEQLRAYFSGYFSDVQTIPVNPGGTAFQQQVWLTLRTIPVGSVITYAQLAHRVGKPNAYRAVGMANGQNPIAIVLPCHRVIGANGQLTGYAGGLERKRWLLQHERVPGLEAPQQIEIWQSV